ncbi:MAG: tRNA preQ1(34) S-adenosylmethionine ribosyltransferase-isomerase QueA [Actinobacteria bacterium]|nr:tRNA preQ1(34) S-adenosylmethionine ribosyltransferase-isomerase QueA [Actinomycetota bacterium]
MDDYHFVLPDGQIAQTPAEPRTSARLLDATGPVAHRVVADLPRLLREGDLLVVNESRVIPARLQLRKATGGAVEVLLLESTREGGREWEALVRPSRRVAPGTRLLGDDEEVVEVGGYLEGGRREVVLLDGDVAERLGAVPLPPYIHTPLEDPDRYQTVYAARPGSVAAPTAGLHLDADLLDKCVAAGAGIAKVDLAVGLDTFRPVEGALDDHVMHSERFIVPDETLAACARAERVIAIGTTTVRALESAARGAHAGRTDLFIRPGFDFKVVDVLLTNFHMPRSTLLVLLAAFCGPRWRELYDIALAEGYRFLSFGDCMLVSRAAA